MSVVKVKDDVWVYTGTAKCFEKGPVLSIAPGSQHSSYKVKLPSGTVDVRGDEVMKANSKGQDGEPDNTLLRELNEATLLHNVRCRYNSREDAGMYTVTGHILIAVNPFKQLSIYKDNTVRARSPRRWRRRPARARRRPPSRSARSRRSLALSHARR